MSTTIDRVPTTGYSGALIMMAGLGMRRPTTPEERRDPWYRMLVRMHKREVLQLCDQRSVANGQRRSPRYLP